MAEVKEHPPYTAYAQIAATFVGGLLAAGGLAKLLDRPPRTGRMLTWTLAAGAANDFLQAGFAAATTKSNELEARTD